jgi:Zn-finger nucleic acid-binding protein
MTYRDRILMCPHCGAALDKPKAGYDRWPCNACQGVALPRPELEQLLARFSEAVPKGLLPIDLRPRESKVPARLCPACNEKMAAVALLDVPADRCMKDDLVWFDPEELESAINTVIAEDDARKGWYRKFRELLFAN